MTPTRRTAAATLLAAVGLLAAGCGSSSKSSATTPPPPAASSTVAPSATPSGAAPPAATSPVVVIKNFGYQVPASVPAGAKITVRNDDATTHSISDKGKAFDVNVPGGGNATFTAPGKPGRYMLYCKYHGNMSGVLVVS